MKSIIIKLSIVLILFLVACSPISAAPAPSNASTVSTEDLQAIRKAASDYIDGWYEGNPARMETALHDSLVKRHINGYLVENLSKEQMVSFTRSGGGSSYQGDKTNTITILDAYKDIATVKTESPEFIDYLHMGKIDGKWVIINVLWTEEPGK
jgi:hypothetical protein